ncbi:beta-lactamase-like protein [Xylaria arbuscula]|nr:beta-lactamase-like protein [Xylaria arbuscula]
MATPVDLNIPTSTSTVNVSIIDTGATFKGLPADSLLEPTIPGHEYLGGPCFSFLIQHPTLNRTLLFDLAMNKDWEKWPKPLLEAFLGSGATAVVPSDVRSVLDKHNFDLKSIEAVIWSHTHFDHIGDVSSLDPSTKIIVGPGTKTAVFPGYPTVQAAHFNEYNVAGHEVDEVDFSTSPLKIGAITAIDYFGDGSFYLLDTPGHCMGHMCALARVTSSPDSFILLGGDAVHHGGELRPHRWHPLPEFISPNSFNLASPAPCPGEIFHKLLLKGKEAPFYTPSTKPYSYHMDVPTMLETIKKLQEVDAHDNIFMVPAHDAGIQKTVGLFPKTANAFMEKGWVQKTRWMWLADFAKAVGQDENIPRQIFGDYRPVSSEKK